MFVLIDTLMMVCKIGESSTRIFFISILVHKHINKIISSVVCSVVIIPEIMKIYKKFDKKHEAPHQGQRHNNKEMCVTHTHNRFI